MFKETMNHFSKLENDDHFFEKSEKLLKYLENNSENLTDTDVDKIIVKIETSIDNLEKLGNKSASEKLAKEAKRVYGAIGRQALRI